MRSVTQPPSPADFQHLSTNVQPLQLIVGLRFFMQPLDASKLGPQGGNVSIRFSTYHKYTGRMSPRRCMHLIIKFLKDESGATAIEYGLIAAGIALAVIAVVNRLGTAIHNSFSTISTNLN